MQAFKIDGVEYDGDDLSFREQRELRRIVRELVEDPTAEITDVAFMDYLPALVYVIRKRDDPEFALDQALDLKIDTEEEEQVPPTTASGRKRKTA